MKLTKRNDFGERLYHRCISGFDTRSNLIKKHRFRYRANIVDAIIYKRML